MQTYLNFLDEELAKRRGALATIDEHKQKFGGLKEVDYKALIEDGRRS